VNEIVVDASITLSWCFPDEQTPLSLAVLDRLKAGDSAIAPAFWSVEVLNSLLVGERRGRISPEQTQAFLRTIQALRPTLDHASLDQVFGPVQRSAGIIVSLPMMPFTSISPCENNVLWQRWINPSVMPPRPSALSACEAKHSFLNSDSRFVSSHFPNRPQNPRRYSPTRAGPVFSLAAQVSASLSNGTFRQARCRDRNARASLRQAGTSLNR
jgi:hypothetical protein